MKLSAKCRYAIAAAAAMAETKSEFVSAVSISEKLGVSKIYLEQVFALLKRGGVVNSTKGMQGGYQLAKSADNVTLFDIVSAVEHPLMEKEEDTVALKDYNLAIKEAVGLLDDALYGALKKILLSDIAAMIKKHKDADYAMFFI